MTSILNYLFFILYNGNIQNGIYFLSLQFVSEYIIINVVTTVYYINIYS